MRPDRHEVLRQSLLEMREILLGVIERQKPQPEQTEGDIADQAARSAEIELAFELSDNERRILSQIEAALSKMDKGLYGRCERCRKAVEPKRLKMLPFARYCLRCQESAEKAAESGVEPWQESWRESEQPQQEG